MKEAFAKVIEFHTAFNHPVRATPTIPPTHERHLRAHLNHEEYTELELAEATGNLVGIADGIADLIYVLLGMAATYGIPIDEVFDEVHRSNMSKLGADGRPILNSIGKVVKGPSYSPPDIKSILEKKR